MVTEYGIAFLEALAEANRPMKFGEINTPNDLWAVSPQTYIQRYLVKPGYVDRFDQTDINTIWYMITTKGKLLIDKSERTRIRTRIRRLAIKVYHHYAFYRHHWNDYVAGTPMWGRTEKLYEKRDYTPFIRERMIKLNKLLEILPEAKTTLYHALMYEHAYLYARFYNDPMDAESAHRGIKLLKALVPKEYLDKYLKEKIIKQLMLIYQGDTYMGYNYQQVNTELGRSLLQAYGQDIEEIDRKLSEEQRLHRERQEQRHREKLERGELCILCGRDIHIPEVVDAAKQLYEETGIKSGPVCCSCFSKLWTDKEDL